LNEEISEIGKKNKETQERGSQIAVEMNKEKLKFENESKDLHDIQASKEKKEENMKNLKSKRADYIADSGE
jgi:hypothetical protein